MLSWLMVDCLEFPHFMPKSSGLNAAGAKKTPAPEYNPVAGAFYKGPFNVLFFIPDLLPYAFTPLLFFFTVDTQGRHGAGT